MIEVKEISCPNCNQTGFVKDWDSNGINVPLDLSYCISVNKVREFFFSCPNCNTIINGIDLVNINPGI